MIDIRVRSSWTRHASGRGLTLVCMACTGHGRRDFVLHLWQEGNTNEPSLAQMQAMAQAHIQLAHSKEHDEVQ